MSINSFNVDVVEMVETKSILAFYKCSDPKCNRKHPIMMIDKDLFELPGTQEVFYDALDKIVNSYLRNVLGVDPVGTVIVEMDQPTKEKK